MKKIFLFIVLSAQMLLVPFAESLELERLCEFLEEYDSSSEKKDWNWNRLAYAVEKGHLDVASFFISMREAVNTYYEKFPVEEGKVNPGYNPNYRNTYYKNPLVTAIRKGYNDLAIEMLKVGVDFSKAEEYKLVLRKKPSGESGHTTVYIECKPAFFVAMREGKEDIYLVQAFLEAELDINALIYFQDNPDDDTKKASSPLYLAIEYEKFEVARFLMEYGADPLKPCANTSPLELSIQRGHNDFVELLLDFVRNE